MTYDPNIPSVQNSPKGSVTQIQTNFEKYATGFSKKVLNVIYNHYPLNDQYQGKHGAVLFENQVTDPTVNNNFCALYNKNYASKLSTQPQLFARTPVFSHLVPNDPVQLTFNTVNTAGPQYQSFLLGGYLIFWGQIAPFPPGPPPPASYFEVTLVPDTNGILNVQTSTQSFDVLNNPKGVTVTPSISNPTNKFTIVPSFYINSDTILWMAIAKA